MKKNTIYIIGILSLSFFISSCCPSKTIEIKEEDKLQINENDMFIYKSNLGNYDTLYIDEVIETVPLRDRSEQALCNRKIYKQQLKYNYQNYTVPFPEDSLLYLTLIYSQYYNTLNFRLAYLGISPYTGVEHVGSGGYYINTYYLGDSIYTDVRYITIYKNNTNDKPYKFFINPKYGILSYEYRTSEKYALIKYIPNN